MVLGNWVRSGRAHIYHWIGRNQRAVARLDGSRAVILNLHRILPADEARRLAVEPGMNLTPDALRMVLECVVQDLEIVPLAALADCVLEGRAFPERACALTFDDGWRDNYDYALPILREFGVPATLFAVTDRVGTLGPFWPDEVCRRLASLSREAASDLARSLGAPASAPNQDGLIEAWKQLSEADRAAPLEALREATSHSTPGAPGSAAWDENERELMTWEELAILQESGIDIESHGASHALLKWLDPEEVERELTRSLAALQARGFARRRLFAYPSGQHTPALHAQVEAAGYRAAFALDEATLTRDADPMSIPRLGVHQGIAGSRLEFRAKIPGWT